MLQNIKRKFEEVFDIPFISNYGINDHDVWYEIGPKGVSKEYFTLKLRFINNIRLNMELCPDLYSKLFIQDLGYASKEQKSTFLSFAQVFQSRRAKVQLLINQEAVSISSWENWPTRWDHIALRISRSPISEGTINYEEVILDWGLSMMAMVLSLANIVPLEKDDQDILSPKMEGNVRQCYVTKYERSPVNRMLCLAIKGYNCSVCGMNFEEVYGEIGTGFIHVHHSVPVSKMGPDYIVNPEKELFPVCPNCHAMLHHCDPPMSIDELKKVINSQHTEETDLLVLT